MSKIDDGGPAFPQNDAVVNRINNLDGMSLRDWFAGQAMSGLVVMSATREWRGLMDDVKDDGEEDEAVVAEMAYRIADAMIAASKWTEKA